jgi:putative transposase
MEGRPVKVWFTAAEYADLAAAGELPGLPATKRGMNALIAREGWDRHPGLCRRRPGREGGGGDEFHVDLLPLSTRLSWVAKHFRIAPADLRPPLGDGDGLTPRARTVRDARLVLLKLAERLKRDQNLSIAAADDLFASLFNARSIAVPEWIVEVVESASARSLARWRSTHEHAGADALGHDPGLARKGTSRLERALDGQVKTFVLAAIAKMPFISSETALELITDRFGAAFQPPPLRSFQRRLAAWKAEYRNELLLLTDPDGYRSKVEFSATGVVRAQRLNQLWMIDASPADVMLREGRHSVYLAIDVFSRRVQVLATRTPRADGVGLLLRKCLIAWGVPELVLTDNGSDFVAAATQRLLRSLGIESDRSRRYDPKSKGKGTVERPIGTFQRDLAGLPGFIGHSVADRKVMENRKSFARRLGADDNELFGVDMDLAAFQAWCDSWSDTIYATSEHRGLGGRTPFEVAASYAGPVRRIDNPAALDILLAPVAGRNGLRTVTKTGIEIGGAFYLPDAVMPGEQVFVRMDPADLGRALLFAPDGETFLGTAACPELAGLDPVETIARVKAAQKAHVDGRIKDIRKEMRRIGPRAVADAMRAAGEKRLGNLVAFPRPAAAHSTPALDAAAIAARPAEPRGLTGRAAELHAEMARSFAPPSALPGISPSRGEIGQSAGVAQLRETREQRFRRALEIERRLEAGEPAGERELLWLGGYRVQPEYRAMKTMMEEFGAAAMRL